MHLHPVLFRVCWNTANWQKPTGSSRESRYLKTEGFGHEEWNFRMSDAVGGYVFAYVRRMPGKLHQRIAGGRFLAGFFTRNPKSKRYELVGVYGDARIPTPSDQGQLLTAFEKRGVFQRRAKEVAQLQGPLSYAMVLNSLRRSVTKKEYVLKCRVGNVFLLQKPVDVTNLVPWNARFMNPVYPDSLPLTEWGDLFVPEDETKDAEEDIRESIKGISAKEKQRYLESRAQKASVPPPTEKRAATSYLVDAKQSAYLKDLVEDTCQVCGMSRRMRSGYFCDIHHVTPLTERGRDNPQNIIVVCPNCHRIIHKGDTTVQSRSRNSIVFKIDGRRHVIRFIGVP